MLVFALLLFGFNVPEEKVCVVDLCESETCVVETPEGLVTAARKSGWFEGKRLTIDECPVDLIEPT